MKTLALVAFLTFATTATAQDASSANTTCPKTGGLSIGQVRTESFKMMNKADDGKEAFYLHWPQGRPYKVEVTFSGTKPDATVTALHYIFNPGAKLRDGLNERYGAPLAGSTGVHADWDVPACSVHIRYYAREGNKPGTTKEEMWLEPLTAPAAK
jgi:hypothetical protein